MNKVLFIFLFSDTVDTYVNAITHSYNFDNFKIKKAILVHVTNTNKVGDEEASAVKVSDEEASTVYNRIWRQIEELSKGNYVQFPSVGDLKKDPQLKEQFLALPSKEGIDVYARLNRTLEHSLERIDNTKLQAEISRIVHREGGVSRCIFDITAAPKTSSINIFSACLALDIQDLYVFQLKESFDKKHPENFVYHILNPKQEQYPASYSYTCIGNNDIINKSREVFIRRSILIWTVSGISLTSMAVSLILLFTVGQESILIQTINILASIIGIASTIIAVVDQRSKSK